MTSKFTSRFRRRDEASAAAPAEAEKASAETAKDTAKTDETKAEAVTAEAAPEAKPAEAPAAPKQAVPPSRLVEVEKPKASRPDLTQARMWLDQANAYRVPASIAAGLVVAIGLGYGIGAARAPADGAASVQTARLLETTSRELRDANGQIGQLAAELKAVKGTVEGIKGERDKMRGEVLAKQAQLSDRFDKSGQENATRIGRLAEQLDRIEKAQRDAGKQGAADKPEKVADRTEKPEKSEKVAAAPTPPAKPVLDVTHTGSIGETKTVEKADPRKTPLEGYVVRDYDEGFALIETRSGRYIDVAVGYTLPGIGRVEAIERRGRQWVVVTPKGYIGER